MHYCALLFTEELPSESEISKIMEPFDENNFKYDEDTDEIIDEYPVFTYDYYTIGGRYKGSIKLDTTSDEDYYEWGYYVKEPRNGRLFWSDILSTMKRYIRPAFMFREEDYFSCMGFRDGLLYVDGARVKDIINYNDLTSYICIKSDGTAIVRQSWNGKTFIEDKEFDSKFQRILNENKNGFVTVLDIHD